MSEPAKKSAASSHYASNPFIAAVGGIAKALTVNPVSSLTIAVLPFVLIFGVFVGAGILGSVLQDSSAVVAVVVLVAIIASLIVFVRSALGTMFVLKASYEGQKVTGKQAMMNASGKQVGRFLGFCLLLIGLFTVAIGLSIAALSAVNDKSVGALIGAAVMILALIVAVRWALTPFVLVNEDATVTKGIKRSFDLTKGHFVEMVGVIVAQGFISGNGLLSIIGSVSGLDTRYRQIKAYKDAHSAKPDVHWVNWLVTVLVALFVAFYAFAVAGAFGTIDEISDKLNDSSSNSSQTGDYCYFDDNFDYTCVETESRCKSIIECKSTLEARENLENIFQENYFEN